MSPKLHLDASDLGEKGHLVSDFIKSQGENPPLQKANVRGCTILLQNLVTFLLFLPKCRHLTYLDLSENPLGEAGHFLTQSIKSSGYQLGICTELFKSLVTCKNFTHMNVGNNCVDNAGGDLALSINSWGNETMLKKIGLHYCSIPFYASGELAQSFSKCKHLTHIFLSGNKLKENGKDLALSIRSWGNYPPLQQLFLHECSMPLQATRELVQSLSTCRKLTHLDLGRNNLGEAGHDLAHSVQSWGYESSLQQLYLYDCLMPVRASIELVQSLVWCNHLTHLDLGGNSLGKAGIHLAQSIRTWGNNPPLQQLHLYDGLLPSNACIELVHSLQNCRHLTHIQLGRNSLGKAGKSLAHFIEIHPIQELLLEDCKMSADTSAKLLQALSSCKKLISLDVSANIQDEVGNHLVQSIKSWGDNPPLQRLYLANCSMAVEVWNNLFQALSVCRSLDEFDAPEHILNETGYNIPDFLRTLMDNQRQRHLKYKQTWVG